MKNIIVSFIVGCLSGAFLVIVYSSNSVLNSSEISVKRISGKKIVHKNFKFNNNSLVFRTESEGKGVIETNIPKTVIPEARAWIERNNTVQLDYTLMYHDKELHSIYGIAYYHRWGSFAIGAGLKLSKGFYGVSTGMQYWF